VSWCLLIEVFNVTIRIASHPAAACLGAQSEKTLCLHARNGPYEKTSEQGKWFL
jgi:hypothetical protein